MDFFIKIKLIFKFIFFVFKNKTISKLDKSKSFSKFNLNSKTYIVDAPHKIEVEDPLVNITIKGYIVQYEIVPGIWAERLEKRFYRNYDSAVEAIVNFKKSNNLVNYKIKPIYILDKAQSREVDINEVLKFE
jgi:hypothetical protein